MKENQSIIEKSNENEFGKITDSFFTKSYFELDYQELCDTFSTIVNAKYCVFNLYDSNTDNFTTVALSGNRQDFLEVSKLLGHNLLNKSWSRSELRNQIIKSNHITQCTVHDLFGAELPKEKIDFLINYLELGLSYVIRIKKNNELIGDFMVVMGKDEDIANRDEAVLFTRFLGMSIIQKRTHLKLEMSERRLADVINFLPDATFAIDLEHKVIIWNKAIEVMTGIKAEEILGSTDYSYSIPFYGKSRPLLIDLLSSDNPEIEKEYTDFKLEGSSVTAQAFAMNLYGGKGAWIYAKASPLFDDAGRVYGYIEIIRDINEQKQTEILLRSSEENFKNLFTRAPLGYQSLDEDGRFIEVNDAWLSTLGYERHEVIGQWFGDFLTDEYAQAFRVRFPIFKSLGKIHSEFFMKHKNGELRYIEFDGRIGYKMDGSFEKTHCILKDSTDRKLTEDKLIESEQTYKALYEFSGVGIGYYSVDGHVISYNPEAAKNMGGKNEDFVGKNLYDLFTKENADMYLKRIIDSSNSETPQDYEDLIDLPSGSLWFFSTYGRVLDVNGNVKGIQIISQDITEIKNKEERISYLSYHDQLTGLYNRRFYDEELSRLDTPRNYPLTIALGDVNGLKLVNDSFGHKAGDELLISVARSIKLACRQCDIIARVGGDEFSIILPSTSEADAEQIIERINKFVSLEKSGPIECSISFGFETKYTEEESIESIIKRTEDHMYRHKLNESSSLRNKTINIIRSTLIEKNKREMYHSERVSDICVEIATAMGLLKDDINRIRTVGLMHDIGKIGIDENILNSITTLSEKEWVEVKKHPEIGYRILSSAPEFSDIADDVFSHHERWDGSGYPRGIKEESISVFARIIAIADAYDAMISERPYRAISKAMSSDYAIAEIKKNAGTQFDPTIAKVFVEKVMNHQW